MSCVSTVSFAVLINEKPTDFFEAAQGLRQGCPLSPLLFLLVIEGLSRLILKEKVSGEIKGIKINPLLSITHLMFVDDIMLVGSGSLAEWSSLDDYLNTFSSVSGLSVNYNKSRLLLNGFNAFLKADMERLFQMVSFPLAKGTKYMGFFIKPNSYKVADWQWLLKRFERRIKFWGWRWLSIEG